MSIFTKEYLKDWLWVLTAITLVFGAVLFPGFSDYSRRPFWWTLWEVLGILCAAGAVGGWCYFWFKQEERDKYK